LRLVFDSTKKTESRVNFIDYQIRKSPKKRRHIVDMRLHAYTLSIIIIRWYKKKRGRQKTIDIRCRNQLHSFS